MLEVGSDISKAPARPSVHVCLSVSVCVRDRERETERGRLLLDGSDVSSQLLLQGPACLPAYHHAPHYGEYGLTGALKL